MDGCKIHTVLFALLLLLQVHCGVSGGGGGGESRGGTILLAWDASEDPRVTAYRVYWGNASGVYDRHVDIAVSGSGDSITYSLGGLVKGQTYFIAVTARDAENDESDYSNEVSGAAK